MLHIKREGVTPKLGLNLGICNKSLIIIWAWFSPPSGCLTLHRIRLWVWPELKWEAGATYFYFIMGEHHASQR